MTSATDWARKRKTLLGASLIAAPLLILISDLFTLGLYDGDDERRYLADIADNEALYYTAGLVGALGAVFLVGAVVALIHLVRVRKPTFALIAGGIALFGAITFSGVWMTFTLVEYEMAQSPERDGMVRLLADSEDSGAFAPLFVTFIGTFLGLALLAIGLLMARTVPRWMAAAMLIGFLAVFFLEDAVPVIGSVILTAALGSIGALVLRSSLEEWEAGDLSQPAPPAATAPPETPAVAAP